MTRSTPSTLRGFFAHRRDLAQLLLVAAALALGINLLASSLAEQLKAWYPAAPHLVSLGGATLVLASSILLSLALVRARCVGRKIDAFFIYTTSNCDVLHVREYEFVLTLRRILAAVFVENKALLSQWRSDPLVSPTERSAPSDSNDPAQDSSPRLGNSESRNQIIGFEYVALVTGELDGPPRESSKAASILREAIEFVVLEKLSAHLSGYFCKYEGDEYIKEYRREDVPELLLQNRLLSLLTTPLENRAVFLPYEPSPVEGRLQLDLLLGENGAMYRRFELVLPRDTEIRRPAPGILRIENRRFVLDLTVAYRGSWATLPKDFLGWYVGVELDPDCCPMEVNIAIDARLKPLALFHTAGWKYYEWLDSFAEDMASSFGRSEFFSRIGWESVSAQMFAIRRMLKNAEATPETAPGAGGSTSPHPPKSSIPNA